MLGGRAIARSFVEIRSIVEILGGRKSSSPGPDL